MNTGCFSFIHAGISLLVSSLEIRLNARRCLICIFLVIQTQSIVAIAQDVPNRILRIYMDNDFFAYQKEDGAYTNGLRIDFFKEEKVKHNSVLDRFYFNAGNKSLVSKGWSLMQVMITSNDI